MFPLEFVERLPGGREARIDLECAGEKPHPFIGLFQDSLGDSQPRERFGIARAQTDRFPEVAFGLVRTLGNQHGPPGKQVRGRVGALRGADTARSSSGLSHLACLGIGEAQQTERERHVRIVPRALLEIPDGVGAAAVLEQDLAGIRHGVRASRVHAQRAIERHERIVCPPRPGVRAPQRHERFVGREFVGDALEIWDGVRWRRRSAPSLRPAVQWRARRSGRSPARG